MSYLLPLLGFLGALYILFYGYPMNWIEQAHRRQNLQSLANAAQFTEADKRIITAGVNKELVRFKSYGLSDEESEFKAVDLWVNRTVVYESDLRNYGMMEYLATAKEVLDRKVDDCDGTAVLAAAILQFRGLPKAQIATNEDHAEVRLGTNILPATPISGAFPILIKLEINFNTLMSFPWGRLAFGVLLFYCLCELGIRCVGRSNGVVALVYTACIILSSLLLETFTRSYLAQPMLQSISLHEWVTFYCGLFILCLPFMLWFMTKAFLIIRWLKPTKVEHLPI